MCGFLTNGLVDSYDGEGDIQAILSTTISIYCNAIMVAQDRNQCRMIAIMPFVRPKPKWLADQHEFVISLINKKMGSNSNIEQIPALTIPEQLFESDGVHLNDLGLSMLHAHLMSTCSAFKRLGSVSRPSVSDDLDVFAELGSSQGPRKRPGSPVDNSSSKTKKQEVTHMSVDSASTDDGVTVTVNSEQVGSQNIVEVVRATISSEMSKFLQSQANTNNLVSNRLKDLDAEILVLNEATDAAMNQANRHILLISGLKGTLAKDRKEKNKQASRVSEDFLTKINSGKVDLMYSTFIPGPPPKPGSLPMLKLVFGSHGDSFHVKKKFDEFRKSNARACQDIYLSPELTRATRVRSAIMAAMVKKRKVQEFVKGSKPTVTKFDVKPDICFRDAKTGKIERRVSFKEACDRFLPLLSEDDLIVVRKVAGKAFSRRLGSLFRLTETRD